MNALKDAFRSRRATYEPEAYKLVVGNLDAVVVKKKTVGQILVVLTEPGDIHVDNRGCHVNDMLIDTTPQHLEALWEVCTTKIDARHLLNPWSDQYQSAASCQYTVAPPYNQVTLNEKGYKLYTDVLQRVNKEDFKDTLTEYCVRPSHSGGLPYYFKDWETGVQSLVCNTTHNLTLYGTSSMTSPVIFMDPVAGWAYTRSGSLYKLGRCSSPGLLTDCGFSVPTIKSTR